MVVLKRVNNDNVKFSIEMKSMMIKSNVIIIIGNFSFYFDVYSFHDYSESRVLKKFKTKKEKKIDSLKNNT